MKVNSIQRFAILPVRLFRFWLAAVFSFGIFFATGTAAAEMQAFKCGGAVESSIWKKWDRVGYDYVQNVLIQNRLVLQGDTYALYDLEIILHNLLSMSVRCARAARISEFAHLVEQTYPALRDSDQGRRWICRGGTLCEKNALVGTEVLLNSTQFVAFAISVASNVDEQGGKRFRSETARIALEHMRRWSSGKELETLRKKISVLPSEVQGGSSGFFYRDTDLWKLVIYSELAKIADADLVIKKEILFSKSSVAALREHASLLVELMVSRVKPSQIDSDIGAHKRFVIDEGYWVGFRDNSYAGYYGKNAPVKCAGDATALEAMSPVISSKAEKIPVPRGIGWDLSHSRRFVHLIDSLSSNAYFLEQIFGAPMTQNKANEIGKGLSNQMKSKIWNRNLAFPLFANYFSGDNGWYRVGYREGRRGCSEGSAPYGLSSSFMTGGFAIWGKYDATLGLLGREIYRLAQSRVEADRNFIDGFYGEFGGKVAAKRKTIAELTAWPSLVVVGQPDGVVQ